MVRIIRDFNKAQQLYNAIHYNHFSWAEVFRSVVVDITLSWILEPILGTLHEQSVTFIYIYIYILFRCSLKLCYFSVVISHVLPLWLNYPWGNLLLFTYISLRLISITVTDRGKIVFHPSHTGSTATVASFGIWPWMTAALLGFQLFTIG